MTAPTTLYASWTPLMVCPLETPTGLVWDAVTPGMAAWGEVTNAAGYNVTLYKDGVALGEPVYVELELWYDFSARINDSGSYTFTVSAVGDGSDYADSATSAPSAEYAYEKPAWQLDTPMGNTLNSNGVAGWSSVANASRYLVQLYYANALLGNPVYTTDTSLDFMPYFEESGMYSFTVQAIGNENYANSAVSDNSNDIEYEKPIEPLAVPMRPFWDASVPAKATWEGVPHASGYSVQLVMDGSELDEPVTVSAGTFAYDFTSVATETGTYTFTVKALGDGTVYSDSDSSILSDRYSLVALPKLDRPTNPVWDSTIPGKAKWTGVANATGYSIQLSIDLMAEFDPVTVAGDVTEYDFTSIIDETGSYTFWVVAIGNSAQYRPSDLSTVSGTYDYVQPTLLSITASFRQGANAVYTSGTLDSLKSMNEYRHREL